MLYAIIVTMWGSPGLTRLWSKPNFAVSWNLPWWQSTAVIRFSAMIIVIVIMIYYTCQPSNIIGKKYIKLIGQQLLVQSGSMKTVWIHTCPRKHLDLSQTCLILVMWCFDRTHFFVFVKRRIHLQCRASFIQIKFKFTFLYTHPDQFLISHIFKKCWQPLDVLSN